MLYLFFKNAYKNWGYEDKKTWYLNYVSFKGTKTFYDLFIDSNTM